MMNSLFPIYLKTGDFKPPADETYYLVAGNGSFLVTRSPIFEASVPIEEVPEFQQHEARITLKLPKKLPREMFEQTLQFFRRVCVTQYGSEAIVLLYWHPAEKEYSLAVPVQRVSPGGCSFDRPQTPVGAIRIGDIHSHGRLKAFHSSTDDCDEVHEDGLHLTFGRVDTQPDFSCSLVVHGKRIKLELSDIFDLNKITDSVSDEWLKQVTYAPPKTTFVNKVTRFLGHRDDETILSLDSEGEDYEGTMRFGSLGFTTPQPKPRTVRKSKGYRNEGAE